MGMFDWLLGSETTYVSSTSYNMAGDEEKRPKYLKMITLQHVLGDTKRSMGEALTQGYLKGPGIGFRSFFRWANNNYSAIGMPEGVLRVASSLNLTLVSNYLSSLLGTTAWVQDGESGIAAYSVWAEQWVLQNRPNDYSTDWSATINYVTNIITINFVDSTSASFTPANFDPASTYIYAYYTTIGSEYIAEVLPVENYEGDPDLTDYVLENTNTTPLSVVLNNSVRTTKSYSDGRPDEVSTTYSNPTANYNRIIKTYTKEDYQGGITLDDGSDGIERIDSILVYRQDMEVDSLVTNSSSSEVIGTPPDEVTVTTSVRTTTQYLSTDNTYNITNTRVIVSNWSPLKIFIYRIGSGVAALDNSIQITDNYSKFFPFVPVRLDNKFLSESYNPDAYALAKKAYKKGTGGKFDDLVESLEENENLNDIDFAFIVYGVSINTIEKACQKYLYIFFKKLMLSQVGGPSVYTDWVLSRQGIKNAADAWTAWRNAQNDPGNVLFGSPPPNTNTVANPTLTENVIRINNTGPLNTNGDMRISWVTISEGAGVGLSRPGAKKGDYWFEYLGKDEYADNVVQTGGILRDKKAQGLIERNRFYYQETATTYKYLNIIGMVHRNFVYNNEFVQITLKTAFEDNEESGFIVPLHYDTFINDMSLVESTQMTTAACHLVLNSYEIVKTKWYETGLFRILLIVGIAIATGGAGIGLLGANIGIGLTMGLTGLTAAIVGSLVNALAALVLTTLITTVSTLVFGDQLGAVIGVLLTFLATNAVATLNSTGSFALNWGDIMKVDNLMKIMDAAGQGYSAYVSGTIKQMAIDSQELIEDADRKLAEVQNNYYNEFGYGLSVVDPMTLTDNRKIVIESGDTFLLRTLMTGSDIADMSMDMISDFTDLTLQLPNAYT